MAEIPRGNAPCDVELVPATEGDLPLMQALYLQENVRFIRSAQAFRLLRQGASLQQSERTVHPLLLIRSAGRCVGYLYLRVWAQSIDICEYAGERSAIVDAARCLQDRPDAYDLPTRPQLRLFLTPGDASIRACLARRGIPVRVHMIDHTAKILSLPSLIEKLRPCLLQLDGEEAASGLRAGTDADGSFRCLGDECLRGLSEAEVNHIVLGNGAEHALRAYPRLRAVLRKIFPLPIPYPYNMNYT